MICKDQLSVFTYLQQLGEIEKEAEARVAEELHRKIEKKEEIIKSKETLLISKEAVWSSSQIDEEKDNIEDLKDAIKSLKSITEEDDAPSKRCMLRRCKSNLIKEKRLKLRKLGGGRKLSMDEMDERFLVDCIMDKATAHGRRHDTILYLNHRVKKKDFLRIVNFSRSSRNLPLVKSSTTVFNRSRPKSRRSMQAKRHCGSGLFCCKKPPKAEDNSGILTHFCRAQKKNIIRKVSGNDLNNKYTLYRSFDDKAYLCPGTSTGMRGARSEKIYQPSNEDLARKLPKYDFPESMVNCTPGTFLFMNKEVEMVAGEETIKTCNQQTIVVTKPKYFVGSSGSVWASHLVDIKHKEPSLYEAESPSSWQSKPFRSVLLCLNDDLRYFSYQFDEEDLLLLQDDPDGIFKEYETKKVDVFLQRIVQCKKSVEEIIESSCEIEKASLRRVESKLDTLQGSIQCYRVSLSNEDTDSREMKQMILDCLDVLKEIQLPKQKSRVIDLTDAGPGVGITNNEVKVRTVEEIRMMNYDYYVRHHLAPGDSSHNEVERIQSYVGM